MKRFYRNYLESNLFFWIFSFISISLIVIAFFTPPQAQIDQSVLIACAELNALIATGAVLKALDKGVDATFQHKDTSLTITSSDDEEEKEDQE